MKESLFFKVVNTHSDEAEDGHEIVAAFKSNADAQYYVTYKKIKENRLTGYTISGSSSEAINRIWGSNVRVFLLRLCIKLFIKIISSVDSPNEN